MHPTGMTLIRLLLAASLFGVIFAAVMIGFGQADRIIKPIGPFVALFVALPIAGLCLIIRAVDAKRIAISVAGAIVGIVLAPTIVCLLYTGRLRLFLFAPFIDGVFLHSLGAFCGWYLAGLVNRRIARGGAQQ